MLRLTILFLIVFGARISFAQDSLGVPQDYAVGVNATITENPLAIHLHWPIAENATSYAIYRRTTPNNSFALLTLHGSESGYDDTAVTAGTLYEYKVEKFFLVDGKSETGYGLLATGSGIVTPDHFGTILVLIDDSISTYLSLSQFLADLHGDGWTVMTKTVDRSIGVPTVKKMIHDVYIAEPKELTSVLLVGHLPVPYSGDFAPDDHTPGFGNHQGAWAADVYYADLSGVWTDSKVDDVTADRDANKNVPGDGKFDQNTIPGKALLQIGRVDLYQMYAFSQYDSQDEAALLNQYFVKDHNYRMGYLTEPRRALVSDSFFVLDVNDVPATNGWRNFPVLLGNDSVSEHPYTDLQSNSYLWSYGCGGGIYFAGAGIGTIWDFATKPYHTIFTMVFGSFFGDWDEGDNLLRAPLASGDGLTSAWAGRPYWFFHHMAMGSTIGYSTMISQNYNGYPDSPDSRGVHVALMGDPTLRMCYGPMAPKIISTQNYGNGETRIVWDQGNDATSGFKVYRAPSIDSNWTQLTNTAIPGTTFLDQDNPNKDTVYLVRAVGTAQSPAGSYSDISQGTVTISPQAISPASVSNKTFADVNISYDPNSRELTIVSHSSESLMLRVVDVLGREVLPAESLSRPARIVKLLSNLPHGNYWVIVRTADGVGQVKMIE